MDQYPEILRYQEANDPNETDMSIKSAYYVLFILFVANLTNYIDRQIPFILSESIKRDLSLSDTQLGLLGGIAFAFIYGTFGIPLARLADRTSQLGVLVGSLISWSLCTIAGSFSQNFGALAASRAGVAIGEAGATPQALSIIDRMFPERGRAMAIAIFSCGSPVGTLIGLSVGGWLATHGSWRTAMFWAGVPGLAIAILLLATASIPKAPRKPPPTHSMFASIGVLLKIPAYRWIVIGLTSMAYASWASITFQPSVLVRSFGLSLAEIGLALGLIQGLIAGLAMLAGGYAGDSLGRRDARWRPRIGMLAMLVSAPFFVAAQFAPSGHAALVLLIIPASCWTLFLPPLYSAVHSIVPPDMKATGIAVLFFFLSVVGSALGPIGTGIASDLLQPLLGENSLRAALASSSVMLLFAAACFFRASQHAAPAPAP